MTRRRTRMRSPRWLRRTTGLRLVLLCLVAAIAGTILVFSPSGCVPTQAPSYVTLQDRLIRVRLVAAAEQVSIAASQPPVYFTSADTSLRQLDLPRNQAVSMTLASGMWMAGGTPLGRGNLTIRPATDGSVRVNDRAYRGQYRLVPIGEGPRFDVINDVDVDQYLKGVLARELLSGWSEEAYRAQAIVARTYAMYEKHVPRSEPRSWDVWADTRSQVYGGIDAETPKAREAVDATAGLVLTYGPPGEERIFKAYFSACCGGITQSAMHAFNEPYIEPLSEQNVGSLCSISPRFNWGPIVIGKDELTRRFRAWGASKNRAEKNMGQVQSVDIELRNRYGRPVRYSVIDSRNLKYSLASEEFRWAVNTDAQPGTTLLSSFLESVVNETDRVRFLGGHGHGHGVGMCQWCAEARARNGMNHQDIVRAAYPGAKLMRAY